MSIYYIETEFDKQNVILSIKNLLMVMNDIKNEHLVSPNAKLIPRVISFLEYLKECYELNIVGQGVEMEFNKIVNDFVEESYSEQHLNYYLENGDLTHANEMLYAILYYNFIQTKLNCGTLLAQYKKYVDTILNSNH